MTTYANGTVSVGANATTMTGAGTAWLTSGIRTGDVLMLAGFSIPVASVNSNTNITLARPWPGSAQSGSNYDILLIDDDVRALAAANMLLQQLTNGTLTSLAGLTGTANKMPYFSGQNVMALTDLTTQARSLLASTLLSRSGNNLVTASNARFTGGAVQSGFYDTTPGTLLTPGAFGLGRVRGSDDFQVLDDTVLPGFYHHANNDPSSPTGGGGSFIVTRYSTQWFAQIAFNPNSNDIHSRHTRDGGASWGAWVRLINTGNVLGAVSQSGGVPTGAVINRGSNANGEFVRFADGTQICRRELAIDVGVTSPQSFPYAASFVGTRGTLATSIGHQSGIPNAALHLNNFKAAGGTETSFFVALSVAGVSSDPSSQAERMTALAVGRWF